MNIKITISALGDVSSISGILPWFRIRLSKAVQDSALDHKAIPLEC